MGVVECTMAIDKSTLLLYINIYIYNFLKYNHTFLIHVTRCQFKFKKTIPKIVYKLSLLLFLVNCSVKPIPYHLMIKKIQQPLWIFFLFAKPWLHPRFISRVFFLFFPSCLSQSRDPLLLIFRLSPTRGINSRLFHSFAYATRC